MLRKRAIAWFNVITGCHLELVERLSSHKNFYFFTDFDIAKPCEFAHFFFLFSLRSLRLCVIILCILNSYQYLYISILIFFIFHHQKRNKKPSAFVCVFTNEGSEIFKTSHVSMVRGDTNHLE